VKTGIAGALHSPWLLIRHCNPKARVGQHGPGALGKAFTLTCVRYELLALKSDGMKPLHRNDEHRPDRCD
jgi:hypothetical protein